MADKWADYLISAVRYNAAGTHIDRFRVHQDKGDSVGASSDESRPTIVAALQRGTTFVTIYKNAAGIWDQGAAVHTVDIGGVIYIRTDRDRTKRDNLDRLPVF